jgi:hypothetical protein
VSQKHVWNIAQLYSLYALGNETVLKGDKILNMAGWMHATGCDCLKLQLFIYRKYESKPVRPTFGVG